MLDVLSIMTNEEKKAASRFNELVEDGEGYDIPKTMMRRLKDLDLVEHIGGGWYEQTNLMLDIIDELEN